MPAAEFRLPAGSTTSTSSSVSSSSTTAAVDLSVGLLSFFLFLFFSSSSLMMFGFVFPFVGLRRRSVLNARCGVGWWVAVGLRRRLGVVVDAALSVFPQGAGFVGLSVIGGSVESGCGGMVGESGSTSQLRERDLCGGASGGVHQGDLDLGRGCGVGGKGFRCGKAGCTLRRVETKQDRAELLEDGIDGVEHDLPLVRRAINIVSGHANAVSECSIRVGMALELEKKRRRTCWGSY